MTQIETRIRNRYAAMPAVVDMIERFGAEHRIPRNIVNDLNMALDEVLNNIISYGYRPGEQSDILIRVTMRPGEITVEIEDSGRPFDLTQTPSPDLSTPLRERKVGGLGIHFVKNLVDDVAYTRVADTNRLCLRKRLDAGHG
jgi:serine/threonine-protein kinase RsbW